MEDFRTDGICTQTVRREEAGMCLQNTNDRISIMSKLDTITAHYTLFNRDIIIELYCVYAAHCYQTNHS